MDGGEVTSSEVSNQLQVEAVVNPGVQLESEESAMDADVVDVSLFVC